MLSHRTIDRLREAGLIVMIHALEEQRRQPDGNQVNFEDLLSVLVDREVLQRDNKQLKARVRFARLLQPATQEDVDYRAHRGLDRTLFQRLAQGEWIECQQNLLITGPTGMSRTCLVRALGQRARETIAQCSTNVCRACWKTSARVGGTGAMLGF